MEAKSEPLGKTIEFEIPGKAVGKQNTVSPHPSRKTGKHWIVPEMECREYMDFAKECAKKVAPPEPWLGACEVTIAIYLQPDERWDAQKKALALSGRLYCMIGPDCDNVSKCVCDGIQGVIFKNDRQVVDNHQTKHFGPENVTVVTVRHLEDVATQIDLI